MKMARVKVSTRRIETAPKSDSTYSATSRRARRRSAGRIWRSVTPVKVRHAAAAQRPGDLLLRRVGAGQGGRDGQEDVRVGAEREHQGRRPEAVEAVDCGDPGEAGDVGGHGQRQRREHPEEPPGGQVGAGDQERGADAERPGRRR